MILDLKLYKLSKIVKKDFPVAIGRVESAIKSLDQYKRYKSVATCIRVLKEEVDTMKIHLKAYTKIEKDKGKK